jgi:plasmid stability protein
MPMIQLRHVPDSLHRKLKSRAALEGLSLSDYLLKEVEKMSELPTMEEMRTRLASREPVQLQEDPTEVIRAERDNR